MRRPISKSLPLRGYAAISSPRRASKAGCELDDLDGADAALTAAELRAPPAGWLPAPLVLQSRARLRLAQQRPADAHRDLLDAAARRRELDVHHPILAGWRADAADALVRLGDPVTARRLAREQLEQAERLGLPGARGAALRALAHSAATPQRLRLLEQAVDVLAHSPARLEHTRALVDLGAALRRANQRAQARVPLRQALDQAERGGMRRLARRARDELRVAGAKPRRSAITGPDALTTAEQRVATLAAQGRSNREIAEQLYVSQRTVETHLTHAFQKLHIVNRTQLAARIAPAEARRDTAPSLSA